MHNRKAIQHPVTFKNKCPICNTGTIKKISEEWLKKRPDGTNTIIKKATYERQKLNYSLEQIETKTGIKAID